MLQDLLDIQMDVALTHHQTHHFGPESNMHQKTEAQRQQQAGRQSKQAADMPGAVQKGIKQDIAKRKAFPKRPPLGRPKVWMR